MKPALKQLVIAAALLVVACSKPTSDEGSLAELRDRMCACKDKACADGVKPEVDAFLRRDRERYDKLSPAERRQSAKIENEEYQCWKQLVHPD